MNDTTTAAAAATTATAREPAVETLAKDEIYTQLAAELQEMTGKRVGKTNARKVFDSVVEKIFAQAARHGSFRFNGGFGSIHMREYEAGSRRLPSGQHVEFGERKKLRYEEGVVVQELVSNGGNLEEALKVRGNRATSTAEAAVAGDAAGATSTAAEGLDP